MMTIGRSSSLSLLFLFVTSIMLITSQTNWLEPSSYYFYGVSAFRLSSSFHTSSTSRSRRTSIVRDSILVLSASNNVVDDDNKIINNNGGIYHPPSPSIMVENGGGQIMKKTKSTTTTKKVKDCVFQFGSNLLSNAEKIDHVANLIKDQINVGSIRPRVVVCSAMGDTTNALLQAGKVASSTPTSTTTTRRSTITTTTTTTTLTEFDTIRELHLETLKQLNLLDDQQQQQQQQHRTITKKKNGISLSSSSSGQRRLLQQRNNIKHRSHYLAGTTVQQDVDNLWNECNELLKGIRLLQELSPQSTDQLVSYGERCSNRILAARLNQIGIPAQAYDGWEVGVMTVPHAAAARGTQNHHCDSRLVPDYIDRIRTAFEERAVDPNVVAIVTGFIAKVDDENTPDTSSSSSGCEQQHDAPTKRRGRGTGGGGTSLGNKITTLGSGGSDLTATAIGTALSVDEIQIWKDDGDGILTADPQIVPDAFPLTTITFEEATELANFGTQVLHPVAMEPCRMHHIPVRVRNTYNPDAVGTLIYDKDGSEAHNYDNHNGMDNVKSPLSLVTAITSKRDVRLLDIRSTHMMGTSRFLSKVFGEFDKHQVSVDVCSTDEVSISLTVDADQKDDESSSMEGLIHDLDADPTIELTVKDGMSILTLIADNEHASDVLATVFEVFSQHQIAVEMMSQGASKVNISFVISTIDLERAIRYLHDCFFGGQCVMEAQQIGEEKEHDVLDLLQQIQGAMKQNEVPQSIWADVNNSTLTRQL